MVLTRNDRQMQWEFIEMHLNTVVFSKTSLPQKAFLYIIDSSAKFHHCGFGCAVTKGSVYIHLPALTGVHTMAKRIRTAWREKNQRIRARISQDFSQAPGEIVHIHLLLLGEMVGGKAWLIILQNQKGYKLICSQPRSKS